MPVPSISFLLGILALGYLSTFVVFAVLRIVTGVSVQRVGFSGFRHIAFSPRDGIKIHVRGLGLSVHRPTFALPTWCSLVITELGITVDIKLLKEHGAKSNQHSDERKGHDIKVEDSDAAGPQGDDEDEHGRLWRKLTEIKEKVKKLHSKIHWIKLVDLVATTATVDIIGVGRISVERLNVSVDTRHKTVDRSRLFQHHKTKPETQAPAEWKCLIRSILFTPEGRDSTELLDYCTINVHGMLHNRLEGLRDASIALKLGRLNIPYDDLEYAKQKANLLTSKSVRHRRQRSLRGLAMLDAMNGQDPAGGSDGHLVRAISDSRAFIASILRGIQEVQFAIGFFGLSKRLDLKGHLEREIYFNLAMKELSLDVLRLDPKSPAHRMYFSRKDVAHQGLLTAIAISAGIDDGQEHPERMVYIPMVTATVRTTLPSRTIHYSQNDDADDRNTNILYANFVCTSPSVDLDPKHLPLVREILKQRSQHTEPDEGGVDRHRLISQFLPKAHIKFAIQEPVFRISLPPMNKSNAAEDDFDLLISSVSSVNIELESSHGSKEGSHYNLGLHYRHTRHNLYYQTASSERHDLLNSDTVEINLAANAIPEASVTMTAQFQTFNLFLVRPEICVGIRQIVRQLRRNVLVRSEPREVKKASFVRTLPAWLHECRLEGTNFGIEIAGRDKAVSQDMRGFALHLRSWTTEYKAQRDEPSTLGPTRRLSTSRAPTSKDRPVKAEDHGASKKRYYSYADGRRLTVHFENLEGLIVDSVEHSEPDSFLSVPRFEVAFSTTTDAHGPMFHINSFARSILLQYSLYNHFAMGVSMMVIKKTFLDTEPTPPGKPHHLARQPSLGIPDSNSDIQAKLDNVAQRELTTVDFKSNLLQVKATMPADPPLMLQIYNIEAGKHRWAAPFTRAKIVRLYVRAPETKVAWSRVVSIKALRLDLRDHRRKVGKETVEEKSFDITTDTIRFAVPHSLVVHSIFDNIVNVIKTTQQLAHHFKTGTDDYILTKEPEGPKDVPRIRLRSQLVLLDIEDGAFEWKLGAIYRTGLQEQKQRMAREDAFKLKAKQMSRSRQRGSSRFRAQSAHPAPRARSATRDTPDGRRSRSSQPRNRHSPRHLSRQRVRYDAEGKCGMSDTSHITIDQARERLQRLNAETWKKRIDRVKSFESHSVRELRRIIWGADDTPEDSENREPILAMNPRPALFLAFIADLSLTIDKTSFPVNEYPNFLHDLGKGMPKDMQYSLLIPMNLHLGMGELRLQLRDYPLPLLHVPHLANGQSPRLQALTMRTDVVIAEEFRDIESQRQVDVVVVPPEKMSDKSSEGFSIHVRRTIAPVKTYTDMKWEINTSRSTKITWGTSYQPAIQDTMQVLEGFTKPPMDPSDRVGFWDKIRLSFHSRVAVAWKGDGDVHLVLKGSRDPYVVTGTGAGLVMVWRNDVRWNIAQSQDPREFMTVDSGEYVLAVPNFNSYARTQDEHDEVMHDAQSSRSSISSSSRNGTAFKKVVMKLSGNVRWLMGFMFERDTRAGGRSFEFKPHYDIVLKHPDFAHDVDGEEYDAYRGFRSNHIHMSIGIFAPHGRDWTASDQSPSNNYNSVHLSPKFFAHFFDWWSMFSGVMNLPVRQGPLWGPQMKSGKKFGRHIATIKYNLLLSPLYISHVYKHKDVEDYQANTVSATGLKMKLDSFMLDLHQRREHFDIRHDIDAVPKQTSGIRINQAQVDFIEADLRALSAIIAGTSREDIESASDETLASLHDQIPMFDMSKFEIPDRDLSWIDMDDFVELDWILPVEADPQTKILPLTYTPRFTYFRQTDHDGVIAGDPSRTSPFGDEPTHHCVMSSRNDPRHVQAGLMEKRLKTLTEQYSQNQRAVGDKQLQILRLGSDEKVMRAQAQKDLDLLLEHGAHLQRKHTFLKTTLHALYERLEQGDSTAVPAFDPAHAGFNGESETSADDDSMAHLDSNPLAEYASDFNNRFIVHNPQIKWNNALRNIILRYIHQVSQRRGFVYYMSRRAVKFILDIVDKRVEEQDPSPKRQKSYTTQMSALSPDVDDEETVQDRIEQLLKDGRSFVDVDDATPLEKRDTNNTSAHHDDIAVEFTPLNTYHFRLIAPQIQLQSEKNADSAVLVTAKGMQLKVVQIMEKENVHDDVSGLVQRRFTAAADSLQMFVTSTKTFSTDYFYLYSANLYGAKAGTRWPPWVPVEVMFEYSNNPYGFQRVVHRTSASVRYDKYNNLRLKYRDDVTGGEKDDETSASEDETEERMDHVWVEFPQFRAICDSTQYFALYTIVVDLMLYNEPLEKTRSERLEKIMLASDFSDLTGTPEMVELLQGRIRQLEEIKMHFQINETSLDRQGWKDRISIDQDLAACEDELFFMMKAITTSQQRQEDRREQENATGLVHLNLAAKEIAWQLIRDNTGALVEFQLQNAAFDRWNYNDGSNYNVMEIGRINGFNLLPDALYPEIIAPFTDVSRGGRDVDDMKMLRVHWLMQEAIAGIPVVDHFEVDIVPLKVQVERDVAKKLFEYIFPGSGGNGDGGGLSPFMVKHKLPTPEEEDETDEPTEHQSPAPYTVNPASETLSSGPSGGPGSLEQRMRPTLYLASPDKKAKDNRGLGISNPNHGHHGFTLFHHSDKSRSSHSINQRSNASRQALSAANSPMPRSPSEQSLSTMKSNGDSKRFHLSNGNSDEKRKKNEQRSDDLTQMMNRASSYMTLAFVKIPSMVLCLSYKGQGKRNIEDVHDLVIHLPTLEYRNKTWSNLDLALQLKKDVIRALISHVGAIVGNKLSHHKPSRLHPGRLREIANRSAFISSKENGARPVSSASSGIGGTSEEPSGRPSVASGRPSTFDESVDARTPTSSTEDLTEDGRSSRRRPSTSRSAKPYLQADGGADEHVSRSQGMTLTRQLTGLSERLRNRTTENGPSDEVEETKRKSKILLGGQKLFRTLRE